MQDDQRIEDVAKPIRRREHGVNVPAAERIASAVAGAALAVLGGRRRGVLGGLLAGLGAALLVRGVIGRSPTYRRLAMRGGVEVRRSIIVQRSRREVYRALRQLNQIPRFMTHVTSVEETGTTSRWAAEIGPLKLAWHAVIVEEIPDRRLSWRSLPGGDLTHEGAFELADVPGDRGTQVTIALRFQPGGSGLAAPWQSLARTLTSNQLATDLIRLRQLLETGEGAERRAVIARPTNGHTTPLPPFTVPKAGA